MFSAPFLFSGGVIKNLKQAGALIATLIAGVFLWLLGAIFMTGVRFDNFGDIAIFIGWNGLVLAIVGVAIRQIVSGNKNRNS